MIRLSRWEVAARPRASTSAILVDILFALALLSGVVAVYLMSRAEPAEVAVVRQYLALEAQGSHEGSQGYWVSPDSYQAIPQSVAAQRIESIRRYRAFKVDGTFDYVLVQLDGGTTLRFDMELFPTMERMPRIVGWSLN